MARGNPTSRDGESVLGYVIAAIVLAAIIVWFVSVKNSSAPQIVSEETVQATIENKKEGLRRIVVSSEELSATFPVRNLSEFDSFQEGEAIPVCRVGFETEFEGKIRYELKKKCSDGD
jgi:hypothetical protein